MFFETPTREALLKKAKQFEKQGAFSKAERTYLEGIAFFTDDYVFFARLGALLVSLNRPNEALQRFQQARDLNSEDPRLWFNSALAHQSANDFENAINFFKIAQEKGFDKGQVLGSLAEIYEQTNRLEDLETLIKRGLRETPDDVFLLFNAAKLSRRRGNYKKALEILDSAEKQSDFEEIEIGANFERGRIWDKLNQPEKAFPAFQKGNLLTVARGNILGMDKKNYRKKIKNYADLNLEKHFDKTRPQEKSPVGSPIYIVGFPRSGTTLLHQILDCHPSLDILDEEPLISTFLGNIINNFGSLEKAFSDMSEEEWNSAAKDLFTIYGDKRKKSKKTLVVDKLPLNILDVPLILKLFPKAKFIVALRHPFDCSLSCFMQNFDVNSAMLNFTNLDDTTKLYQDVFTLWLKYEKKLKPDFTYLRYEDLIGDLEKEIRRVLSFLGLDWTPEVLKYREKAKSRDRISTPSYHQVIQPLYRDSLDRWRTYQKFFKPFRKRLVPFCETFGYDHRAET